MPPDQQRAVVEEAQRASGAMALAILAARRANQDELADQLTRVRDDFTRAVSRWRAVEETTT